MRSRLAVTLTLVFGLMFTGAGGTVAVTGLAGDGDAGTAQYGEVEAELEGGKEDDGAVLGSVETRQSDDGSAAEQVAQTGDDDLPFTGFAAIPLLVGGVGLLGAGAALRRSQRDSRH